jgi:chorismate dehydratase
VTRPLQLGRISYVNMAPLFERLETSATEVTGVPTDLNARLCAGELDLAPISSIEWARHARQLLLLPRLCVSSEGAVDSIQIVSRKPAEHIRTLAATSESATSTVLARILLPHAEQVPFDQDADATLLIGDAALRSTFDDPTPHYDLGRLWQERTGLPMVYAVFATPVPPRAGVVELENALLESHRVARAEPEDLAREASARHGYPAGFLARYFEKLRYRFDARERAGLMAFLELACEVGELEAVPDLQFLEGDAQSLLAGSDAH